MSLHYPKLTEMQCILWPIGGRIRVLDTLSIGTIVGYQCAHDLSVKIDGIPVNYLYDINEVEMIGEASYVLDE